MSDHAEDVQQPDEPVAESSPAEQVDQGAAEGTATPSDSPPENEPPRESGAQKRIRELTWHRRQAEARVQELEQELARRPEAAPQPSQPAQGNAPPVESDFDSREEYQQALDTFTTSRVQTMLAEREQQAERQSREAEARQRQDAFRDACGQYAADNPSFLEDIEGAKMEAKPHLLEYMVSSEAGPQLLHYLAKNPDHASRIEAMPNVAAIRELALVESTIGQAQGKRLSDAPPPMSDVSDGPTVDPDDLSDNLSVEEWMERRRRKLAR